MSAPLRTPLLALDTVSAPISVSLVRHPGEIIELASEERAGAVLHDLISGLLRGAGLTASDLGGLAVCRGPGSFTGLRVGLAAASGLAMAARVPALGIESTRALALATGQVGRVAILVDGGQGRVFAHVHEVTTGAAEPMGEGPIDASLDEALALMTGADASFLRGAPPEADRLLAAGCRPFNGPAAGAVAQLALGQAGDPATLAALYGRAPAIRPPAAAAP